MQLLHFSNTLQAMPSCGRMFVNTVTQGSPPVRHCGFTSAPINRLAFYMSVVYVLLTIRCPGQCLGVREHFISVNYRTNAWVNWSDFSVAYWGWLEERSFSMISSAAYPRWPLQPPSWIWLEFYVCGVHCMSCFGKCINCIQQKKSQWQKTKKISIPVHCQPGSPPKWCPSSKIVPNKIAKKQYILRFFIEIFGYKTFVKIYLILPEIFSVINSRESGFSRILKSEGAIGCQRH
jgi:hypothetical protein